MLEWRALIPILLLVLEALRVLVAVTRTNWSIVPLLRTLLRDEALAVITTRTSALQSPLPILTLAHIIQHNCTVHQSLEGRISIFSQL